MIALAAAAAAPAPASAAEVELMVVGKQRVLREATDVRLKERSVKVGRRSCRVAARTPLAVLAAARLKLGLRDYGRCGKRPRDAVGLYVAKVAGERERGRGGWVYKVGRRARHRRRRPERPEAAPGDRVTWFWCEQDSAGSGQRTLEAQPDRTAAAPGETLRVRVRGYDDQGKGVDAEGATVVSARRRR